MEVTIRLGTPADLPIIASIVHSAFSHYIPRLNRTPPAMLADYASLIASSTVYIAESASAPEPDILGLIVLTPEPENKALKLGNLAVAPHAQGKGIGRKLMDFAEAKARREGFASVKLQTNVTMTENRAIYGKWGYKELREFEEDGLHKVYMELIL